MIQNIRRPDPVMRNKRLFTAWIVRLNNDNELVVEGTLECGRRARTKPIAERLSASRILSKFKHMYYLVGNMTDSQFELPGFVRHRFHNGFPQDWESVVSDWKNFVISGPDAGIRSSLRTEGLIIEKKLKLAVDGCEESHCFVECPLKVDKVDGEKGVTDPYYMVPNIANCGQSRKIAASDIMRKSVRSYESEDDRRSDTTNEAKQLAGWTPLVVPDESGRCYLVFRGTLLSSTGHAVSKNYMTDAVCRRLSPRIIATVNQEFYELIGDVSNVKRDIPKELVIWCRYGCPKEINSFCEKWRILRRDEMKFQRHSPPGRESKMGRDPEAASLAICHKRSEDLIENSRTNPLSTIQPVREKKKRKRLPEVLNDDCTNSDTSIDDDMTCDEKPGAKSFRSFRSASRIRSWPKIRRNIWTDRPDTPGGNADIAEGENSRVIEQAFPTATHENRKQPSPLKPVPSLSYVYHRCAPPTESVLSDGV